MKEGATGAAQVGQAPMGARTTPRAGSARAAESAQAVQSAQAAHAATMLPAIESQVMCVTCKIPLSEARSPQATAERLLIGRLIGQGRTEAQIEHVLVAEYGPAVLALPRAGGFDLALYLAPPLVLAAAATLTATLLRRWRRNAPADENPPASAPRLSAADEQRLRQDMDSFER